MYKIFAFGLFLSITLTMASVFSDAKNDAVLGIDSIWIFFYDIAIYTSFLIYTVATAVFSLKPKFAVSLVEKPRLAKLLNILLDIIYYSVALFISAFLFIGFSKFSFQFLITNDITKRMAGELVDNLVDNSQYGRTVLTLGPKLDSLEDKLTYAERNISHLTLQLHATAKQRFLEINDQEIVKSTANGKVTLLYDNFIPNEDDLENRYFYNYRFCNDSSKYQLCQLSGLLELEQDEVIQKVTVTEFANDLFKAAPIYMVDVVTNKGANTKIFYPNKLETSEYVQLDLYQFPINGDTYAKVDTSSGETEAMFIDVQKSDESRKVRFDVREDGTVYFAEYDSEYQPLEAYLE